KHIHLISVYPKRRKGIPMQITPIFMGLSLLGVGRNPWQQRGEAQSDEPDTTKRETVKQAGTSSICVPTEASWEYEYDTVTLDFKPVKVREVPADSLTAEGIETMINHTWPNVQGRYIETFGDTVYLEIPESTVLTQQMGTAGAEQFMVSTTYSF